jgi:RES domain-containing protein
MDLFRISQSKYINDLTGAGAKLYGGRWNRPGVAALYTSQARSLALLELIVHFNSKTAFQMNFSFLHLQIDDSLVSEIDQNLLPHSFLDVNDERLWDITDQYFANSLAIKVPSVVIPQEYNVILNPIHEHYHKISVKNIEQISFDSRFKQIL